MVRRRDLAWALFTARAAAQAPAATTPAEDLAGARERMKNNLAELQKVRIPIATEPAFAFKA